MLDITSVFPTADELRTNGVDGFSLYLFEEELRSILRLIAWATDKGFNKIHIEEISKGAIEFLIEKGYELENDKDSWWIKWE